MPEVIVHGVDFRGEARVDRGAAQLSHGSEKTVVGGESLAEQREVANLAVMRQIRLDGVDRGLDPGPSADAPYETEAELLPGSLREAIDALKQDSFFREKLTAQFVDYYVHIKNAEIDRFQAEVSEWEHREYFEMF